MKKVTLYFIVAVAFVACNVPKDGEQENIPTSKLEVLTNLGEDSTNVVKDTTHSEH
ncbi:MAG: hypothetical protein JNJ41_01565 [Bacteroidia bacterium]|nr:hypothetical protein [Bacteroidia bacterium]